MPQSVQQVRQKYVQAFERGCGWRVIGGTYFVSNMLKAETPEQLDADKRFHPLSYFMMDPPIIVENPAALGLSAVGYSLVQDPHTGIWDVYDWIGASHYPNVADFWEEMAALDSDGNMHGGSMLAQIQDDWSRLTPHVSKRWFVHPNGYFQNWKPYRENWVDTGWEHCFLPENNPKRQEHLNNQEMCAALWWQHVTGMKIARGTARAGVREIGSTKYAAAGPIKNVDPKPCLAIVGYGLIDELHVIAGNVAQNPKSVNDKIAATIRRLQSMSTQLPIFVTNS